MVTEAINKREIRNAIFLSLILLAIGLIIVQYRWINPDEGAHLTDAKLLLSGKVPIVDFQSRQPFYVLLLAIFLKIFGMSYISGRLLILAVCVGNSILINLITAKIFGRESARVAQLLYIFFPFTLMYLTIVKMPNVMLFWLMISILFYLIFYQSGKLTYLFFSGIFLGLAYYVRESSLAGLATLLLMSLLNRKRKVKDIALEMLVLISGFLAIVFLVMGIYLNFMTLIDFINSPLNPLYRLMTGFSKLIAVPGLVGDAQKIETIRTAGQQFAISIRELRLVIRMNFYLIIGFVFFLVFLTKSTFAKNRDQFSDAFLPWLIPIWLVMAGSIYGYYFFARGFFPAYALELYPPMLIGFAVLWVKYLQRGSKKIIPVFVRNLLLVCLFWAAQLVLGMKSDFSTYFAIGAVCWVGFALLRYREVVSAKYRTQSILGVLALIIITIVSQLTIVTRIIQGRYLLALLLVLITMIFYWLKSKKLISSAHLTERYIVTTILVGALLGGLGESAKYLNLKYDGVWSPMVVKKVDNFIDNSADNGDTILSGAMIWAIHPKVMPYFNIAHPTAFLSELETDFVNDLSNELKINPPKYIIFDGYTKKCFHFLRETLEQLVQNRYCLCKTFDDEKNHVQIFVENLKIEKQRLASKE